MDPAGPPASTPRSGLLLSDRGPTAGDPSAARSIHHSTIVTPEGVVLELRAAGVASRILAKGIDLLIQGLLLFAVSLAGGVVAFSIGGTAGTIMIVVLIFIGFFGYPIVLETWWDGKTVGKNVFRLKVLSTEGGPVTFRHSTIRALLGLIDFWFPAPGGLVALAFALSSKRSQRLGDLAAGTIVVRVPKIKQAPVLFGPAPGVVELGSTIDASRLQAHHYTLVREFLLRAHELTLPKRWELSKALAERVAAAIGAVPSRGVDAEVFLHAVLFSYQRRYDPVTAASGAAPSAFAYRAAASPPPPDPRARVA